MKINKKFNYILGISLLFLMFSLISVSSLTCYQESANTTNQSGTDGNCGLNYTGSYLTSGTLLFGDRVSNWNGVWNDYASTPVADTIYYVYVNYTKPSRSTSASWKTGFYVYIWESILINGNINLTRDIPTDCWNYNSNKLVLRTKVNNTGNVDNYLGEDCFNGTWKEIIPFTSSGFAGSTYTSEDGIFWNITDPTNITTISNGTINTTNQNSSWGENANLTFTSDRDTSSWFNWFVDGISRLSGIGQNIFNWVFNNPVSSPNSTVILSNNASGSFLNESFNISTNSQNPNINIIYPVNGTTYSQDTPFTNLNYSFSDATASICKYNVNGGINQTITCGTNVTNVSGINLTGTYTINLYATDNVTNSNMVSSMFLYNRLPYNSSNIIYQCGEIATPGIYNLNQSLVSNNTEICLRLSSDNITIELNNKTINGTNKALNGYALFVNGFKNISIKNGTITNYDTGLYINSNNSYFSDINIINTGELGFPVHFYGNNNTFNNLNSTCATSLVTSNSEFYNLNLLNNLYLRPEANNNSIYNSNIYSGILWYSSPITNKNTLIYNNSFGKIDLNLVPNNDISGNLTFGTGKNIIISNNLASVNSTVLTGINITSANVSLYNLRTDLPLPKILKDGVECTSCFNFTSLNAGNVTFNVSSWSSYSINNPEYNLSACGVISLPGYYTLNQSLTTTGTCLNITSDNVYIDLNNKTIDGDDGLDYGVYSYLKNNIRVKNGTITDFYSAIAITSSSNNVLENINLSSNGIAIYSNLNGANYYNISCTNNDICIGLNLDAKNNTFYNLNSINDGYKSISSSSGWGSATGNKLIYNNSYGQINFSQLTQDVETNLTFGTGKNIIISNNSAYVNSTALPGLNLNSNITLIKGITSFANPQILRDKLVCSTCVKYTSNLNDAVVIFGATGFSNYTIGNIPLITLNYPTSLINYGKINGTLQLNITATDSNLDKVWYNYNGTNVSILGALSGVANLSNITLTSKQNITTYANNTNGGMNITTFNWDYKILEINQTFLNKTIEGSVLNFSILTYLNNYSISSARFFYNGVNYSTQIVPLSIYSQIQSNNFLIPQVISDSNFTFYWEITLNDSTIINTDSNRQEVINLGIDNCSVYTNKLLNITVKDEGLQTLLANSTVEINVNLLDIRRENTLASLGNKFENSSNYQVCISSNITQYSAFSMDAVIKYYKDDYAVEYYNIQNYILDSNNTYQNLLLYDLNLSSSTDFQLTFTGTDFLPAKDVLVFVNRQYIPENVFKTVELPITDSNGQTILHLVTNNVLYNLVFMKDGVVLKTFYNMRAYCNIALGSCTLNLNAIEDTENQLNYNNLLGIVYSSAPLYNQTTNTIGFSYSSFDGTSKNVLLEVKRNDIFGNISICNNSLNSISGTVSCTINPNIEDTNLETYVSVDGKTWIISSVNIDGSAYGNTGYVLWFIVSLAMVLMFSRDKNGILIALLVGYIGAVSMGIVVGGIIGAGSAGIWIIIVTFVGLWKLNKNKLS